MDVFRKTGNPEALRLEELGLRWLAAAPEGAAVVDVAGSGEGWLETQRVSEGRAGAEAAEHFGRALARTHAAGAPSFGSAPPGWSGNGWMGDAPMVLHDHRSPQDRPWGEFYARERVLPYLPQARGNGSIDDAGVRTVERCAERLEQGVFDAPNPRLVRSPAARIHGDLWSGNLLWSRTHDGGSRGVLIDPAAHGGHAESDLAQLGVFSTPHRERIVAAYDEASPLAPDWQERVALHQLHILLVHAALFGGHYGAQSVQVASRYS